MANPKFKLPKGVQVPDGKMVGDTFNVMATLKLGSGGDVELTEVEGESLGKPAPEDMAADEGANDDTSQPSNIRQMMMGGMGQN